jgi:hypothetical protein
MELLKQTIATIVRQPAFPYTNELTNSSKVSCFTLKSDTLWRALEDKIRRRSNTACIPLSRLELNASPGFFPSLNYIDCRGRACMLLKNFPAITSWHIRPTARNVAPMAVFPWAHLSTKRLQRLARELPNSFSGDILVLLYEMDDHFSY